MKALITAGGNGTRLRPITYTMNKHLIPIANKPMIVYALEKVAAAGIRDVALNINEGDRTLADVIGDGTRWGLRITYIEQHGGAQGLAHIIKNARVWLGDDDFLFYLGDNIILGSLDRFIQGFKTQQADVYLALSKVPDPHRFGVPEIAADGSIRHIIEKPEIPPSEYAVTGIYCYTKKIHNATAAITPSGRGEFEISDAHNALLAQGGKIRYEIVQDWWKDTGKPNDLLEGNQLLLDVREHRNDARFCAPTVRMEGTVDIHPDVELMGNTILHGPVSIGEGSVVRDAVIGPHVAIGARTTVTNATIANSIIMDDTQIATSHRITNSIIGHNVIIRDTATTSESQHTMIIGENSLIEF